MNKMKSKLKLVKLVIWKCFLMSRGIYRGNYRGNGCGTSEYRGWNLADVAA